MKITRRISDQCIEVSMPDIGKTKREPRRVYKGNIWWHAFEKLAEYEEKESRDEQSYLDGPLNA